MKHFAYVLYVGVHAQRNLCDKQNVLFYGTPRKIFFKEPKEFFYFWIEKQRNQQEMQLLLMNHLKVQKMLLKSSIK